MALLPVASQFASVDTIPNAVRSQLSTKILLGSAPAELVRMVFPTTALGLALLVSLKTCRWTARKRTRTLSGSISPENWKMFLNGGLLRGGWIQKGLVAETFTSLAGRLDRQPKAEEPQVDLPRPSPGEP